MLLYTIMPEEILFSEDEEGPVQLVALQRGRATVMVAPAEDGSGTVVRLYSTDPRDYLDPRLAPGCRVPLAADSWRLGNSG